MKRSIFGNWIFAMMMAPVVVACSADTAEEGTAADDVVGALELHDHVTVADDSLTFDSTAAAQLEKAGLLARISAFAAAPSKNEVEPVILIGNRATGAVAKDGVVDESAKNQAGYLRRALSFKKEANGSIVIKTEHASVPEATNELIRSGLVTVTRNSITTEGVRPQASETDANAVWSKEWNVDFGFGPGGKTFDLTNNKFKKVTFEKQANGGVLPIVHENEIVDLKQPLFEHKTPLGSIKVSLKTAKINVSPKFAGAVNVNGLLTNSGFSELSGGVTGEFEFEAVGEGAMNQEIRGSFHIARIALPSESGPLSVLKKFPLSLSIEADWVCKVTLTGASQVNLGAKASGSMKSRVDFQDFKMKGMTTPKPEFKFERIGPTFTAETKATGRCEIMPVLQSQIFDSAGPFVGANLWTELNAQAVGQQLSGELTAKLTAGAEIRTGGQLKPFGFDTKANLDTTTPFGPITIFDQKVTVGTK